MDSPYSASLGGSTKLDNLDMFDEPYTANSPGPPMVAGARYATYQLCKLMNKVMVYTTDASREAGDETDLRRRAEFYRQLTGLCDSLPPSLQLDRNFTHQTCLLW